VIIVTREDLWQNSLVLILFRLANSTYWHTFDDYAKFVQKSSGQHGQNWVVVRI